MTTKNTAVSRPDLIYAVNLGPHQWRRCPASIALTAYGLVLFGSYITNSDARLRILHSSVVDDDDAGERRI